MNLPALHDAIETSERRELSELLGRIQSGATDGIAELKDLARRFPASPEILGHLSWALAHAGQFEQSIDACRRYLEIEPANVEIKWRIGDRLVNLGRLDDALAQYRSVLEQQPDSVDAKMGVRYVLYRQKKGDAAIQARHSVERRSATERQTANKKHNEDEFRQQSLRLESLPPSLYLESTTKCNFYCKTCSKGYDPYHAEDLRADIRGKVAREVMPTNVRISITGFGEPTLSKDFDDILSMGLENGSIVHFVTNASLLNFERIEKLTRCPVEITISFDGARKETFEEIRAGADFDLILDKLAMVKKLRDIHLSSFFSIFSFNFVALQKNIDELAEVVRIAHSFGIDRVSVADYAFNFNEFDEESLRYDPDHANRCLKEAANVAAELGVRLDLPPPYEPAPHAHRADSLLGKVAAAGRLLPEANRFPRQCSSPWTEPYIHTDGLVSPCCASRQYLGDLRKQRFTDIWNGWRYRLLRWRIHSATPPLPCRKCFLPWGINGGNAGNVMAKEGLLVKAFYWLELRLSRLAERASRILRNPPEQTPNYRQGRPIGDRAKPESL